MTTKDKEAVSPPGWGKTVEKMKEDHKEEIDNPFALAWYMHNKGDKPHHKESAEGFVTPTMKILLGLLKKHPMTRAQIMKAKEFHGWDKESIEALVKELMGMNVLVSNGNTLSLHTASCIRVAARFIVES